MRYAGNTAVAKYRADCRLINRYHGNKKVAGWKWSEQSGVILPFADTFNDKFQSVKIHGAIVQSGSGDPSPDNVRPFVEVKPSTLTVNSTAIPLPDMGPIWGGGYRDYAAGIDYAEQAYAVIDGVNADGHAYCYQVFEELDSTWYVNVRCNNIVGAQGGYIWCNKLPYLNNNFDVPHIRGQGAINNQASIFLPKSVLPASPTYQMVNAYFAANPMQMVRVLGAVGSVPPTTVVPVITHFTPITIPTYPKHTVISAEGAQVTARCRVVDR